MATEIAPFSFVFQGRDAERHSVDMRLLGISLVGLDRIVSDGLIVLAEHRLPKRKERAPVVLLAREPKPGSTAIYGDFAPVIGQLPLLWSFVTSGKAKAAMEFVAYILKMRGGRPAEAAVHSENMLEQLRITEAARDRADARWHDTLRYAISTLAEQSVDRLGWAARQAVAPVGRSVDRLQIGEREGVDAIVDTPMAEVIREGSGATVGDQERIIVAVDGYQHHNRTLKIARLDGEGYMSATVTDPAFELTPNIYTEAASLKAQLVVEAKKTLRDGKVERLHISNAIEILRAA